MKYTNLTELFKATADAIRAKKQTTDPIVADSFPEEIEGITTSGNSPEADLALKLWEERSKASDIVYMFQGCSSLTTVPLFDTSNTTVMSLVFYNCSSLTTVPSFDIRKVTNIAGMFYNCSSLTDCYLRNIKANIIVSNSSTWGNLLTLDSLIHLIKECRDTGSQKTLTIGSVNLEKLADTYVRTVEVTDEMRAEDDLIDEKLPFELCESTDEGAMHIVDYAATKHWTVN